MEKRLNIISEVFELFHSFFIDEFCVGIHFEIVSILLSRHLGFNQLIQNAIAMLKRVSNAEHFADAWLSVLEHILSIEHTKRLVVGRKLLLLSC